VVAASVLHFVEQFLRKPMQENLQMELTREGRLRTATMKISIGVGCFEGRKTGCGMLVCDNNGCVHFGQGNETPMVSQLGYGENVKCMIV
jgi:hypothetical protein